VGLNRLAAWLLARDEDARAVSRADVVHAAPDATADENVAQSAGLPVRVRPQSAGLRHRAIFRAADEKRPRTRPRELALVAATALLAAALWLQHGASWQLVPAVIGGLLLLLIAAIDLDRRLVLNEVVLAGAALAVLQAVLAGGWGGLLISLAGGGAGFGLFLLVAVLGRVLTKTSALGAGDIKLAGLLGLMFGFPAVIRCLLLGVICGGLISGGLLLTRRLERKTMIPYAPFLVAGGIITLLTG
jgi:prepilin signal peptidase PulO-like enzyme (type II secretory pathway)